VLVVGAGIFATLGVNRIRVPLQRTVDQATAITERRFITVDEPEVPELRNVTRAMNAMVGRVKAMFDEQAGQVELMRRQAHCDPLTGLSNRAHFLGRMKVMLDSEDGAASGALVMVRLVELQALNRTLGRSATDRLLQDAAAAMIESSRRVSAGEVGRLNGSDFALALPHVDSLRDWGYAGDYVEAMWLALQHDTPDDWVVATGESHTVRELCELAFAQLGLDYREHVRHDARYLRPAEVDHLRGDSTKAREQLGWRPKVDFAALVKMMVESDLELAREEQWMRQRK